MERCVRLNGKNKMERCGRLNGKMWKTNGKERRLSVADARLNHLKCLFRPIAISLFNVSFEHDYEG